MSLEQLIKINKIAAAYFVENLEKNAAAKKYVYDRTNADTVKLFRIGYAPSFGLVDRLKAAEVRLDQADTLGLIKHVSNNYYRDVFSNRIMFPIVHAGMVVGFGGRDLGHTSAKYINNKASPLYNKKEVLYGLWYARSYIHKKGYAVVVEGYFDFLSLFAKGLYNTVSTCGTALTEKHASILSRYTSDAKILFDDDEAGIKNANKAKKVMVRSGLASSVVRLSGGMDPDDYVNKFGGDNLIKLIENS